MATVTLKGNPIDVAGVFPRVGQTAPAFTLVGKDLKDVSLDNYAGKRKILNIVASLDTSICATSARTFHTQAGGLANTVVLLVSADLPFASNRFCSSEGLDNVVTLSTFRDTGFRRAYGVDITSGPFAGLCARGVVVLDETNTVLHAELVPEIAQEPDYAAALAVLK